jgi:formylglycine-generating enzyme required for sulfatase activity
MFISLALFGGWNPALAEQARQTVPGDSGHVVEAFVGSVGQTLHECPECPEIVVIPTGSFMMGSTADELVRTGAPKYWYQSQQPKHAVSVGSFAVAKYAVTRGEFAVFVGETGYDPNGCRVYQENTWAFSPTNNWRNPGFAQSDRDPVVCVSWDDAQRYAAWVNRKIRKQGSLPDGDDGPYRPPTEAEWEYAARAGTTTARFWGDETANQCEYANGADLTAKDRYPNLTVANCRDGHVWTAPVGSFRANPWGLYDMAGNVDQWVLDCWHLDYTGAPSDGSAWITGSCGEHVVRGGSWVTLPQALRSSDRAHLRTDARSSDVGFRLIRALQ